MTIDVNRDGQVLLLTINRPAVRNALDENAMRELHGHLMAAALDDAIRAVVLTGAGDKAFSAGLDLASVATHGLPSPGISPVSLLRRGFAKPVIAAVNGAAVGGGFELALACDLRVAAEHAVFRLPEVGLGLAATDGGTDLALRIPLAVALEIGLTGDPISAQRAMELGLVNRVVPAALVLEAALRMAQRIGLNSPAAVASTKRLMYGALDMDAQLRAQATHEVTAALSAGSDAQEGISAFLQKRPPLWSTPAS